MDESIDGASLRQGLLPGRTSLLVRLTAKDGGRAALLDLLNSYTDGLDEEPGTEVFVISVDPEDANTVWLYEVFQDTEAEKAHRSSEGFAVLMEELPPMLDGSPAVLRMDPLRISLQEGVFSEDWAL